MNPIRPIDATDRQLIALLQANARMSTADLARKLHIARTSVVARLARLERDRVIVGYTARLAADAHEQGVQAYVGISVSPKSARSVQRRLEALPELRQLSTVSGGFDFIALLRADSPARLDTLLDEIGEIDGVVKTHDLGRAGGAHRPARLTVRRLSSRVRLHGGRARVARGRTNLRAPGRDSR